MSTGQWERPRRIRARPGGLGAKWGLAINSGLICCRSGGRRLKRLLLFPSCCSFAGSFSKTFTGREKEELLVPFSPGDFLLKGCFGEYLQSKQSTEIASPCDTLFSWVLWGPGGGDRVAHTGLPPSTVWPGPCLCRVLRLPLKSRSCKVHSPIQGHRVADGYIKTEKKRDSSVFFLFS